jgi:16S rRNA (adenine1518-N6/adenine1519-N6)-dimethyltransferase
MPLTPSETHQVLDSIGHKPKKKLGQNFLVDGNIVKKSLAMSSPEPSDNIVEIGPGLGTLTEELLGYGCLVHAVELDPKLASFLREKFRKEIGCKTLTLTEGDAVKQPTGSLKITDNTFRIVANLPYAISSPWLESILGGEKIPQSMTLMLQKEASDRMWAKPSTKNYNALSIFLHAAYKLEASHAVSRQCFFPVPAVDSVLIHMERVTKPFLYPKEARSLIRRIFTKRRKQMGAVIRQESQPMQEILESWLMGTDLPRTLRAEQISPDHWQKLAQLVPG